MNKKSVIEGWFVLLLVFPFILFFLPKDSEDQCRKNIKYQNNVIILHNCDTHSLTSSSSDFHKYLFEWENNPWKGRPLYILTGTIISPVIFPFSEIIKTLSEKKIQTNFNKKKFLKKFPIYLSFILLQYFFLYLCLKIVFFLVNKDLTSLDKLLITGTILSTPLISSMFWHVHPSFLIITLPFFSLLFFNLGLQATFLQNRKIITLSIISGMLILFYQLFVVIIPMFFLGFVLGNLKSRNKIDLLRPIIFSLTFFIPLIFWFLFNYFNSTNIFYESSKYSQFSWILNIENLYDLKNQVQSFVNQIDNAFRYHWLVPFFLIIIMLFKNKLEFSNLRNIIPLGSIFFIVIYTIIIFLMGYYLDRFLSAIVITLNITAIYLLKKNTKKVFVIGTLSIFLSQVFINIRFPFFVA